MEYYYTILPKSIYGFVVHKVYGEREGGRVDWFIYAYSLHATEFTSGWIRKYETNSFQLEIHQPHSLYACTSNILCIIEVSISKRKQQNSPASRYILLDFVYTNFSYTYIYIYESATFSMVVT